MTEYYDLNRNVPYWTCSDGVLKQTMMGFVIMLKGEISIINMNNHSKKSEKLKTNTFIKELNHLIMTYKKQLLEVEHEKLTLKLTFNNSKYYNNAVIMKHYCNLYYKKSMFK